MSQSDEQLNQETTEVEETAAGPIEPQELEDTYQQDQLEAYIAERKAAQEQEEAEEAEPESDCPDGDCGEEESDEALEDLARRAAAVGISDSEIEALGSLEALESTVEIMERRGTASDVERPDSDIDLSDVPEEYRGVFEKLQSQVDNLQEKLGQYNSYVDVQQERAAVDEFDGFISELGPSVESLFGTGPTDGLQNSEHQENRIALLEEMNILAQGYEAANREVPDEPTLFKRALNSLYADDLADLKVTSRDSQVAQRRGKHVSRPTQRHGRQMSPEAAAMASVRAYMEEAGINNDPS